MPRPLDSVSQGGFVKEIEVVESNLDAVVSMLGITDPQKSRQARDWIYSLLEDFETARVQMVPAKSIRKDVQDLEVLAEVVHTASLTVRISNVLDALEALRTRNPVLHRRLRWVSPRNLLHDPITAPRLSEDALQTVRQELSTQVSVLKDSILSEDGRGRPRDRAALAFTSRLWEMWSEFTGRGTARQNACNRERDPFGDFVEAAGRLLFPRFKGRHLARKIHEIRKGDKKLVRPRVRMISAPLAPD